MGDADGSDRDAIMAHRIFQRHHKWPWEVHALPPHRKAFIYASEEIVIKEEEMEQKRRNKMKNKRK